MTTSERVAYLKGMADGLGLDKESKEGKLFSVIIDVLDDIAMDLESIQENALDLSDEIDELSDDLAAVEDIIYDDEDEDEDEDDDEDEECSCCGSPLFYELKCPACGDEITIDEDILNLGAIECPNCGEVLEFDIDDENEDGDED